MLRGSPCQDMIGVLWLCCRLSESVWRDPRGNGGQAVDLCRSEVKAASIGKEIWMFGKAPFLAFSDRRGAAETVSTVRPHYER